MNLTNKPVETVTKFDLSGNMIPLRIRFDNEDHTRITADIYNIVSTKSNNFAGINTIDYVCLLELDQKEHMIELRYHVPDHKWVLRNVIY